MPIPRRPCASSCRSPRGASRTCCRASSGQKLSEKWGQPVVVENKVGAAGNIGMAEGARAAPDGYTLVLAPAGNLTVNPTLFPHLPFDTHKDLTPVTVLANLAQRAGGASVGAGEDVQGIHRLRQGESRQAQLRLAGRGQRRAPRGRAAQHRCRHQDRAHPLQGPRTRGERPAGRQGADDVRRRLHGAAADQAGKLVALAIASPKRSPQLPDVPTVAESGCPDST